MRNMFKTIAERLNAGEELVLVTVIASSGATPRGAGARMLVGKDGRICGTIGGGAVEYRSEQIAKTVLEEKRSGEHDFSLTKNDVQNLGMICGGAVNVYFSYIPAHDSYVLSVAEEAERRFAKGEDLWLLSRSPTAAGWASGPRTASSASRRRSGRGRSCPATRRARPWTGATSTQSR